MIEAKPPARPPPPPGLMIYLLPAQHYNLP
jgi:hypothetical protein